MHERDSYPTLDDIYPHFDCDWQQWRDARVQLQKLPLSERALYCLAYLLLGFVAGWCHVEPGNVIDAGGRVETYIRKWLETY